MKSLRTDLRIKCRPSLGLAITSLALASASVTMAADDPVVIGGTITGGAIMPYEPGVPGGDRMTPGFEERIQGTPRTWKDMRDAGVVRQGHDYSCGSAALATLLSGVDENISEREILLEVLEGLTDDQKRETMEQGLSLLDLKTVANRRGYRAEGYRVGPDLLTTITRPVIVFIEPEGYRHFAVLKGVRGDRVFLSDPARGNVRMPVFKFLDMWLGDDGRGVLFVVGSESPPLLALAQDAPTQPERMAASQLLRTGPFNAPLLPPR